MVQIIDTTDNKEDITEEAINNIVDILDKTGGYKYIAQQNRERLSIG